LSLKLGVKILGFRVQSLKLRVNYIILAGVFLLIVQISCEHIYQPKPAGYFRIALPKKTYKVFDSTYPYIFEYPEYSKIVSDNEPGAEPYWINLEFRNFKGTLHISYKPLRNNLKTYLEDSRTLAMKHITKANSIEEKKVENRNEKVSGLIYNITGTGAASTYQFYLTDSTKHFLRGALYFNFKPNNDSIEPVIEFIKEDIDHLIESLRWKDKK
jgi:gliding motility-associated lipoprotein GldD